MGKSMTLGRLLDTYRGYGPGFDFLRVALALSIIAWHVATLTGHREMAHNSAFWMFDYALVPAFFALSGFLVAGSGMRLSLKNFMLNRVARIVPALAVDIFFAALVIGPLLTTFALYDYLTHRTFFTYFMNIFGSIHYLLPGVFKDNPSIAVNGALWTVPYEIGCYVVFAGLMATGIIRNRVQVAAVTIALLVVAILLKDVVSIGPDQEQDTTLRNFIGFAFVDRGARLLPSFLIGVVIYQWRDQISYSWLGAGMVATAMIGLSIFGSFHSLFYSPAFHLIMLPAVAYLTVFLGLTPLPRLPVFSTGDYSYGLYLYHPPFIQAALVLFPGVFLGAYWWTLFFFVLPFVLGVAALSWHFVEKPTLKFRKNFSFSAREREAKIAAPPPEVPEAAAGLA